MKKLIMIFILLTITGCTTLSKDQCISYKNGYSCYTDGKWVEIPPLTQTIGSYFTWENCKDFLIASLTIFGAGATAYGQSYKQPTYQTYQSTMPRSSSTHCSSNGLGGVDCRTNY